MRSKIITGVAALALVASSLVAVSPANARWHHYYHRGGGGGAIAGFAAGAILGGVLASQQPYGYGPGYYAQGYEGGDAVGYCISRFRSYDPASGTYLGYDGQRHSCP